MQSMSAKQRVLFYDNELKNYAPFTLIGFCSVLQNPWSIESICVHYMDIRAVTLAETAPSPITMMKNYKNRILPVIFFGTLRERTRVRTHM